MLATALLVLPALAAEPVAMVPVWKKKVLPEYPAAGRALGLADVACRARLTVDERGTLARIEVAECPAPFEEAVRAAATASAWYPATKGGVAVSVWFDYVFTFSDMDAR